MNSEEQSTDVPTGFDRRTLLKRGAVVGGTAIWATPVIQSLARPAFAAGSPVCVHTYRFKYDVNDGGGGEFDNGEPAGGSAAALCLPDGYGDAEELPSSGEIPGHVGGVEIRLSDDGRSAEIVLPAECVLLDGDAKAGGRGGTLECDDAEFLRTENGRNVYGVTLPSRDISFVAGVICCS